MSDKRSLVFIVVALVVGAVLGFYIGRSSGYEKAMKEIMGGAVPSATTSQDSATEAETAEDVVQTPVAESEVTMADYCHEDASVYAYMSVKNNTSRDLKTVRYRLIYKDMQGTDLDYFDGVVYDLAAGMTKQCKLYGFRWMDGYYYYKNKGGYSGKTKYQVSFTLLEAN